MKYIEIDITTLRTRKKDDKEIIVNFSNEIIELIRERLKDIREIKKEYKNFDERGIFERFWSPDTIVVEGSRGSGKTTQILILKDKLTKEYNDLNVYVLDFIDPTNLTENIDILQVLFNSIKRVLNKNYKKNKLKLNRILEELNNLSNLIYKLNKLDSIEDIYDLMDANYRSLDLPFQIHKLAKNVCEYLEVDALILIIDDIDLNVKNSFKVLSFLKDFFSTPYIIPIVAFNNAQVLAVIMKEKYEYFGLKVSEEPKDISDKLEFLSRLPSEWLQKIFPPSRTVSLPDMLKIFEDYKENKDNKKVYFVYKKENVKFRIEFEDAIKLYISLVYGWDIDNFENPYAKNLLIDYLKNLSLRDFLNDVRAMIRGILHNYKEGNSYSNFRIRYLKDRLKPYHLAKNIHPEDSIKWFWEKYFKLFRLRYQEKEGKDLKDIIKEILDVSEKENSKISKEEKTFFRILLQSNYMINSKIYLKKEKGYITVRKLENSSKIRITKEINLRNLLRLLLRTIIPAYIFYWLVKEEHISFEKFDFSEFSILYDHYTSDDELEQFFKNIINWGFKYTKNPEVVPIFINIPNLEGLDKSKYKYFNLFFDEEPFNAIFKHIRKDGTPRENRYFNTLSIFIYILKDLAKKEKEDRKSIVVKTNINLLILSKLLSNYLKNLINAVDIFEKNLGINNSLKPSSFREDIKFLNEKLKKLKELRKQEKFLTALTASSIYLELKNREWSLIFRLIFLQRLKKFIEILEQTKNLWYKDNITSLIEFIIWEIESLIKGDYEEDNLDEKFFDLFNIFITKKIYISAFFMSYILPMYHLLIGYIKEIDKFKDKQNNNDSSSNIKYNPEFLDGFIPREVAFVLERNFKDFQNFIEFMDKVKDKKNYNYSEISAFQIIFRDVYQKLKCSEEMFLLKGEFFEVLKRNSKLNKKFKLAEEKNILKKLKDCEANFDEIVNILDKSTVGKIINCLEELNEEFKSIDKSKTYCLNKIKNNLIEKCKN